MAAIKLGTVVGGDFKLIRRLAGGAMGVVYVAEQQSTGKERAVKFMAPQLAESEKSRERFVAEARVGSRIQSDHVVEVVAAGTDDTLGMPWLAMELLDGQTLASAMKRRGAFSSADTLEVFAQLCHGLGAAHRVGLVHRDLKPENIFLATPRRAGIPFTVKILDFGIAKLLTPTGGTAGTLAAGSPLWTAPEQLEEGREVRTATDVWPLGLIAFKLLTGKHYWRTLNDESALMQLIDEIEREPLEPPRARAAAIGCDMEIPAAFDAWFLHCVNRSLDDRFGDADVAMEGLRTALEPRDAPVSARITVKLPPPMPPRSNTSRIVAAAVAVSVVVLVAAALLRFVR